jgi:hypothetical protein
MTRESREIQDPDSYDPDQTRPKPIRKIRSLIDKLNRSLKDCRKNPRGQSIDEEIVPFKGRSVLRLMMKNESVN